MKNRLLLALTLSVALFSAHAYAQTSTWVIDLAHSSVNFEIIHMGVSHVHGAFGNVKGTVTLNEKDIARSSVAATIDTTTVSTGVAQRDTHLKSADFFDVEKNPAMAFKSTSLTNSGGKLHLIGDLTINGIAKPVSLAVEFDGVQVFPGDGSTHAGFSASTEINRDDFGVDFNMPLGVDRLALGKKIAIEIDIQFVAPK